MNAKYSQDADKIDVRYVAHLARLHLGDGEATLFQGQLEQILEHVRKLNELDVEGVEPTAHAIPVHNVFRADEPKPSLDHDQVMANAPHAHNGQFVVPKIVE
ncbi:MAG: Glutamyl-tRNA(Gln) amidotransferase subunit C [Verrucomicrobia bacterium ADurb.Bin345]|nr:MAG: Glutamyl-tRNA(Gln) amidotransferase subunit C [Verrucomicrobia bacterium ADurb.Bin345]